MTEIESPSITSLTTLSHKHVTRVGGGLGASGGIIIGAAFFLTWITIMPISFMNMEPLATLSGWGMLTTPYLSINFSVFLLPILITSATLLVISIRAWFVPASINSVWAGTATIITSAGTFYLAAMTIGLLTDERVEKIFPGYYLVPVGMAFMLSGAVMFVIAANPLPPRAEKPHLDWRAVMSLIFGLSALVSLYGVLFFAIFVFSPFWAWVSVISSVVLAIGAIICGRLSRQANRRSWGFGRFGELFGYAVFAVMGLLLLFLLLVLAILFRIF